MARVNPRLWWRSQSQAARLDLFIRGSFYSNFALVPLFTGGALLADAGVAAAGPVLQGAVLAVAVVHAAVCVLATHRGIGYHLGRRGRPTRLLLAGGVLTAAGTAAAVLAYPAASPGHPDGPATAVLLALMLSFVVALSTSAPPRVTLLVAAAGWLAMYGLTTAQRVTDPIGPATAMAVTTVIIMGLSRMSLWMLRIVWELERSRAAQASLAVAEERLRFARDLHDVLGRTLSVVALKAEVAAQLAKRGRAEAVDEMLEVRRIAQESLAEVRAVVGGYRTVDLTAELAGARSLLASAGVRCTVTEESGTLPGPVQSALAWVVREGTTNVLRHSEARDCTITLERSAAGSVVFTMYNDGVRSDGQFCQGSGLIGLSERIAVLGGTVTATRRQPDGFRLRVTLAGEWDA